MAALEQLTVLFNSSDIVTDLGVLFHRSLHGAGFYWPFFTCFYLLFGSKSFSIIAKMLLIMKPNFAELEALQRMLGHYQRMSDMMQDAIKQFDKSNTPEGSTLTFSIRETPIVKVDIDAENGSFCESFFISWYRYYQNKIAETSALLQGMGTRLAV